MRPITPTAHGIIDYVFALTSLVLPRSLRWSRRSAILLGTAAVVTIASSAVTDYRPGIVRLLPLQAHLRLDGVIGVGLLAAQSQLTEEETATRVAIASLALAGLLVALLTRLENQALRRW